MKIIRMAATFTIFAVTTGAVHLADARPFSIDTHGAMCQAEQGPTTVTYDVNGVHSLVDNVSVICPLSAITMTTDTTTLLGKVNIKIFTTGSVSCTFQSTSDGGHNQTLLFDPTPGTYFSAPVAPVDEPIYPEVGGMPVQVSLNCTLKTAHSSIGSIRIETVNYTAPATPGAPMAMTGGSP